MNPSRQTTRRHVLGAALGTTAVALAPAGVAAGVAPAARPIGNQDVGPNEDLMREHGVLRRILLVYDEAARRLRAGEALPVDRLHAAADLVRRFVEGYHEKLEEDELFPRFERAGRLRELVAVLRRQHEAGRQLTASILSLTAGASAGGDAAALADRLAQFTRMYRPHAAREDTELFPGLRELVSRDEYRRLGDAFEKKETQVLGEGGFERSRDEVVGLEQAFGMADLSAFTPRS